MVIVDCVLSYIDNPKVSASLTKVISSGLEAWNYFSVRSSLKTGVTLWHNASAVMIFFKLFYLELIPYGIS